MINKIDQKYLITLYASSITFYIIISILSLLLLAFQILNITSNIMQTYLFEKIISFFYQKYGTQINILLDNSSLNGFSIFAIINIFWSASRVISQLDRIGDFIYQHKKRRGFFNRLRSFFMFSMLMIILIFEMVLILFSDYLIVHIFKLNYTFVLKIWHILVEILILFFSLLLLYIYIPPKLTKVKEAIPGALFSSILIYLLFILFSVFLNLYQKLDFISSFATIFSISLFFVFFIIYIIILGLILNYKKLHHVNIAKLFKMKLANNNSDLERRKI